MRRLALLRAFRCDVLIFDTIGENWIKHCLPGNCTVGYLDLRQRIPLLLSVGFLFRLFKNFLLLDKSLPGRLAYIWLSALLDHINPRLILTCADNNPLISRYARERPDIPVIFLQNALRDTVGSVDHSSYLPIYLSLGNVEVDIFNSIGVQCREYRPTGSIKLGLALARYKPSDVTSFDLCFISHYRPELFSEDASILFQKIVQCQHALFKSLIDYATTNNLSLVVICKTRESSLQDAERDYFTSIAQSTPFEFTQSDKEIHEFNSYLKGLDSGLIVHPASTLGFELFAAGKKVLFGASADPALIKYWGIGHYFDALPEMVKLQIQSCDLFNYSCDRIRAMPMSKYRDITQSHARTIVSMPEGEYPHDVVRRLINNCLD
jgi:surface carbohydrate biosynthesis protein